VELLNSALTDEKRGLGREKIRISTEQVTRIAEGTNGDARKALTMLESIVIAADEEDGEYLVDDGIIEQMIKRVGVFGDKKGSHFFNLLSAL
ncbi:replication-associated recombination protein A, partial [Streptococcus pneumoniae]|nr:replication-associated recombination protein A [Streptococcus pneumoniae]